MTDLRRRLQKLRGERPPQKKSDKGDILDDLRARIDGIMKNSPPPAPKVTAYDGPGIEGVVSGDYHSRNGRKLFIGRAGYERGYVHGNSKLEEILQQDCEVFGVLSGDLELAGFDPRQAVFIDTETTGLSGGSGTYAFLVGIGYFEENQFVVEQFFLQKESEEEELLRLLGERFPAFRFLVSFNGKSYDLPLLETRFILNRLDPGVLEMPHLDLLYPARRIWKRSLQSCRLAVLEEELLGVMRSDDVPGALIPGLYFDFLRSGDPTRMERVFYHNRLDIFSLVTLAGLVQRLLSDSTAACRKDGFEHYSLGRIHLERGRLDEAAACFEEALRCCPYAEQEWEILKELSRVYKKMGVMDKAVQTWKEMIGIDPERDVFPYVELAKHYEHREGDFDRATDFAAKAFRVSFLSPREEEEIRHRLRRVRRKQER